MNWTSMSNASKFIIAVLLVSLFIRLAFAYAEPVKWWDETVYADLGWDLKSGGKYSFDGGWSDYNPDWPNAGYRAPVLPYLLGTVFLIFGQNMFMLNLVMPVIGTMNVLLVYLIGKKLFSRKIGIYASVFLALMPVHVVYSGKILTDVLSTTLITLSIFLFVWSFEGVQKSKKTAFLSGAATAFSFLSRYVSILLLPAYAAFLVAKQKSFSFITGKKFLLMCLGFVLVLVPWLFYGYNEYGNPLGPLIHSKSASGYWGGVQQWYEILPVFPMLFSVTIVFAVFGICKLAKKFTSENNILIMMWFFIFLLFPLFMLPHKEERYFTQLTPALAIISAIGIENVSGYFKGKGAEKTILYLSVMVLFATLAFNYYNLSSVTDSVRDGCFLNASYFLKNAENNSLIFTDKSPIVYFYTHKETHFLAEDYERMKILIKEHYQDKAIYYVWEKNEIDISKNDSIAFSCPIDNIVIKIYRIRN